jgi:Haloacid dehalogenase-like hydrolase
VHARTRPVYSRPAGAAVVFDHGWVNDVTMTYRGAGCGPAAVLLDLDGTLVDSAEGILGSLRAAFAEVGVAEPAAGLGRDLLGPPMYATLPPLIGSAAAEAVVVAYRRIYAETGWSLSMPYPGVDAMVRDLAEGFAIAVATSKQEAAASMIVSVHDGVRGHPGRRAAHQGGGDRLGAGTAERASVDHGG